MDIANDKGIVLKKECFNMCDKTITFNYSITAWSQKHTYSATNIIFKYY